MQSPGGRGAGCLPRGCLHRGVSAQGFVCPDECLPRHLTVNRITDRCKKITFLQLLLRMVNIVKPCLLSVIKELLNGILTYPLLRKIVLYIYCICPVKNSILRVASTDIYGKFKCLNVPKLFYIQPMCSTHLK